jgi:hydroxymethylpyrimidine pyrophosphatase-like HAD family hydrolase
LSALEIHLLWPHPFGVQAAESYDFTVQPFTPASREARFCKVMVLSPNNADLQRVAAAAAGWPVERAFSMPTILELTPLGVNKGTGLQLLLQTLGRAEAPVYAAGDGENDLAVLEKARRAFVPHTAPEAIRAHATRIVIVGAEGLLTPMLRAAQADRSSLTGAGR